MYWDFDRFFKNFKLFSGQMNILRLEFWASRSSPNIEKAHPKTHPTKQAKTNKLNFQHMFHCQSQKMKTTKLNIFEIQILQKNINFIIAALKSKWRGGKFERILFFDNFTQDLKKIKFRQFYVTVFWEHIAMIFWI